MNTTRCNLHNTLKKVQILTSLIIICMLCSTVIIHTVHAQDRCIPLVKSKHYATHGTLDYLERPPNPNNAHVEQAPLVFALHGLGHHKEGFSGLAKQLPDSWRLIFLNAPFKYRKGRAWYRYRCPQSEQDLNLSIEAVLRTVTKIRTAYPRGPKPAIFGFSQGGVMTMAVLSQKPSDWTAAANFSGYWLSKKPPTKNNPDDLPPLLLIHGERDQIVPFDRGLNAAQIMSEAGYLISWLPFDGGHHVPRVGLQSLVSHFDGAWDLVKANTGHLRQEQGE
ncbi:MAG: hypothetical protein CMH49_05025 [Myxococcales bacterium]|nr:hypothetical protein [Myxococcales bacterium]